MVDEAGLSDRFEVDSAGTGSWHVGETAHPGTRRVLAAHGVAYSGRARQVRADEMADADVYVVAMDQDNLRTLRSRYDRSERLYRLLDFASDSGERDVPDPYYSGNFEYVYRLVETGCRGLLQFVREREQL
jgi:protein-tyrosine phosphatase